MSILCCSFYVLITVCTVGMVSVLSRFSNLHKPNPNAVQTARSNIAAERQASAQNRRLAMQMAHRPQVVAAMKLKKVSVE